tara:strand:- start:12462 stop:13886 length:1425 start_codon:yes stop_codon:yes gene_type:complete
MGIFEDSLKNNAVLFEELEKKRGKVLYDNLDELKFFQKGYGLAAKPCFYATRLTSSQYLAGFNQTQAVFKIIDSGIGMNHLNILSKYVTRDLEYQNDTESLQLRDEDGKIIENADEFFAEWGKHFPSTELLESQKWKVETLTNLKNKRDKLEYFAEQRPLSDIEQDKLFSLNQQIKGKYYIKQDGTKLSLKVNTGKDFYHMMFSVGGSGHNKDTLHRVMLNVISRNFATKGIQTAHVLHADTNNYHFHVIANAKSSITNKAYFFDKLDLFAIRQDFAAELTRNGINRGAVLKKDQPLLLSKIINQVDTLSKNFSVYESQKSKANKNAVQYKEVTLRKIEFLSKALHGEIKSKNDLNISTKELKDKIQVLNKIKQDLLSKTSLEEIEQTVKALCKEFASFNRKFEEVLTYEQKQGKNKASKKRYKSLNKQKETSVKEIKKAIKYFKSIRSKDNKAEVDKAIKTLKGLMNGRGIER